MKFVSQAVVLSAAAGIAVVGGAGIANAGGHGGDARAKGAAVGSPGVFSGNLIQVPIHIPINACGNTVDVIGVLNPAFGNICVNR
ncbi:chaplin [Streptomyces sp. S186]|uniref:chaplin n=1 Tax=Streptomyces sp. S186 TaxID=3434395 RepID=UPI003F67AF40